MNSKEFRFVCNSICFVSMNGELHDIHMHAFGFKKLARKELQWC